MRTLFIALLLFNNLFGAGFSKHMLLGSWEISSSKSNSFVSFGKYIGTKRNETLQLLFNPRGFVKVVETGDVYNYEVENHKLKIYETRVTRHGYQIRYKNRYDLFQIIGSVDGCLKIKVVKKKIQGLRPKEALKMCKISNYPRATYRDNIDKYDF